MKILVTGGAGYIGSHTIVDLIESSYFEVYSIDNFVNSDPDTFNRIEKITGRKIDNINVDITDYQALKSDFFDKIGPIDGIIHFAALKAVGESVEKPLKYYENNINGLINLLKCAHKYNVPHFIFSSSCTVYGNTPNQPVTEDTPTQNIESPYGFTKLVGEKMLADFASTKNGFSSISLRYFNPVGAHMSGLNGELPKGKPQNLIPAITQSMSGWIDELIVHGEDYRTRDGSPVRDYIHVSDIAHAHVLAIESLINGKIKAAYEVFNLGTGNGVTVLEVIKAFEHATGINVRYRVGPRRAGDVEIIYADNSKAQKILGWNPTHSLEDAMKSAWMWQQRLNKVRHGDTVLLSEL